MKLVGRLVTFDFSLSLSLSIFSILRLIYSLIFFVIGIKLLSLKEIVRLKIIWVQDPGLIETLRITSPSTA